MSDKEKKREQSMRLFEALANVSPELLVRSEKEENKVIRLWGGRYGGYVAACLAILLVGGISLYSMQYFAQVETSDSAMRMNGTSGGASGLQGAQPEQAADFAPQAEGDDGLLADMSMEKREENDFEGVEEITGKYSQKQHLEASIEEGQDGRTAEKDMESNDMPNEAALTEMSTMLGAAERQKVEDSLSAEDLESMGVLAEYLPMSLPKGYVVSDTRISVDEGGNGNYVIVMRSQEGNVLEYRVSHSKESNEAYLEKQKDVAVIYVEDLWSGQFETEENRTVVVLYEDNVIVEVWGDYTVEILREIYPEG